MLEPERIIRLEDDCVVVLDQRRLPDEAPYPESLAGVVAG